MSGWRELMQAGRFSEAEPEMLAETNGPDGWSKDPETQGWFYEKWGDADSEPAEAIKHYCEADRLLSIFASWSTSGGEGTARMRDVDRVREKVAKVENRI